MCPWKYWRDMSYEERLKFLKWPTLQQRRLFPSLIECKTINRLNGLDPSAFFTFAYDFRPLRANHRFKLKFASATLNSFKYSFLLYKHQWNTRWAFARKLDIFTCENNMLSSRVKISPLLWLHNRSSLSHQKTIKVKWFGSSLVFI